MKPVYIKMQAFGSYLEETVSFADVKQGLFLITGDTGAGKTTIFDAITFALYGKTSGGKRDGKMMRSQYAAEHLMTKVEFCFQYSKEQYIICRTPEQPKYKQDKETGRYVELKTRHSPTVELTLPDGSVFPGKIEETNQKIAEIIGLSVEQFTQVAMLAQGDFMKLLLVPSKERKEIFAKIFDTQIYGRIEQLISAKCSEAKHQLTENEKDICREAENIRCIEESSFAAQWKKEKQNDKFHENGDEGYLELLKAICEETEEKQTNLEAEKKENQKRLDEINKKLQAAEEIQKHRDKKRVLEQEIQLQTAALEGLGKAVEESAKAYDEQYPGLQADIQILLESLGKYEELASAMEAQKKNADKMQRLENETKEVQERLEKQEQELLHLEKEIENLKTSVQKLGILELKIQQLQNQKKELDQLSNDMKEFHVMEKERKDKEAAVKIKQEQAKKAQQAYDSCYQEFIANQAAILRAELKDGEPCPVCGSIHHAEAFTDRDFEGKVPETEAVGITEKAVHEAKEKLDAANREREKAEAEKQNHTVKSEVQKRSIEASCKTLFEDYEQFDETTEVRIMQCLKEKREALESCNAERKTLLELEKQLQKDEKTKQECKEAKNRAAEMLREKTEQLHICQLNAREYETEVRALQKQLKFAGKQEAQKVLDQKTEAAEQLKKQREDSLKAYNEAKEVLDKKSGELEQTLRFLKDAETSAPEFKTQEIETEVFRQQKGELLQVQKRLDTAEKELFHVASVNRRAYENTAVLYRDREELRQNYMLIKNLDDTANGKLSRKHINFQTYIQRQFFRQVIASANQRLIPMSKGQFRLQCQELTELGTKGEVGLDLNVYSIVNDQTRDVKTLSGGESFMAALAMALGMADIIQNSNGKVHIDTVFIDEGFGALSDETREEAIAVLGELAHGNRLVGIISHVTELKAQVDTKLIVSKGDKGSRTHWEL